MATFGLVTFTDTKLAKIKRGIYDFWNAAHRQSTLRNLRVGGDTVDLGTNPTTIVCDASAAGSFTVATSASTNYNVFALNMVDGQAIRLLVTRAGDFGTLTFISMTGLFTATTGAGTTSFFILKVASTVYFVQTTVA